jgi:hypothetical protein
MKEKEQIQKEILELKTKKQQTQSDKLRIQKLQQQLDSPNEK